ncbi:Hpt domain-containing protein [Isoptericola sp. NPDC057391]|uniref:Hpt domain-containing protein n=1 Tax=Isoptericola sp. NPDC057391 TaxID=3346117 RepID=UPI00362F1BAC
MTATPGAPRERPGAEQEGEESPTLDDLGLDDALAALARRAHDRNRGRARRLSELLAAPRTDLGAAAREEAMRLCHTMAGSAATFGELGLSRAATRLETALGAGRDVDVQEALDLLSAEAGTG